MPQMTPISPLNLSAGILQPALQHRWKISVEIMDGSGGNRFQILTNQAVSCDINYVARTCRVSFEQSLQGTEYPLILELCSSQDGILLTVDILDGQAVVTNSMVLIGSKVINHKLSLDYSVSGAIQHDMVFEYFTLKLQ